MSSSGSGYNSGEDVQQAKPNIKQPQIVEPFLSVTSPNEEQKDLLEKSSQMSYQPPVQQFYQSETQVLLDDFHA